MWARGPFFWSWLELLLWVAQTLSRGYRIWREVLFILVIGFLSLHNLYGSLYFSSNVFSLMYVKYHNTSFISSWLLWIRLFSFFPFSCPNPMLGGLWDGPFWVSSVWLLFSSVLSEDLCSFLLPGFVLSCFLIIITIPRVARDYFCSLQYSPACRRKAAWIRGSPLLEVHRSWFLTLDRRCVCIPSAR